MSKETYNWLNNNTLIGFTEQRGTAWHYREAEQGTEPNHYPGAIPVADVKRRLFAWQQLEVPVYLHIPCGIEECDSLDAEGQPYKVVVADGRKAIATSDTHEVLGIFKSGYTPHQYDAWLVDNVEIILDGDLGIGSAGLLANRARAFVSVEVPENIQTPQGVEFRPHLLAATAADGSLSTTYKRCVQLTVCDNTLAVALGEKGQTIKVKHSRYSDLKVVSAREALALVHETADEFTAQVERLTSWEVTPAQWARLLDKVVPIPDAAGRGKTLAEGKRDRLVSLYQHDNRVAPWSGTAFGVLQAFNTFDHHFANVRGCSRQERNASNALLGVTEKNDRDLLEALALV